LKKEYIATGKTIDEAIAKGCAELNINPDSVEKEVITRPKSGFLGIGATDAKVKLIYEVSDSYKVRDFLNTVFEKMNLDVDAAFEEDNNSVHVTLSGENIGIIIGHRGETLDSLQYLATLVANKDSGARYRVTIDTENYRVKREEILTKLAKRLAIKAVKTQSNVTLEPMSANERRIIHSALQEFSGVSTHSIGEEPRRKVVITYDTNYAGDNPDVENSTYSPDAPRKARFSGERKGGRSDKGGRGGRGGRGSRNSHSAPRSAAASSAPNPDRISRMTDAERKANGIDL